jgi:hypothetical protein
MPQMREGFSLSSVRPKQSHGAAVSLKLQSARCSTNKVRCMPQMREGFSLSSVRFSPTAAKTPKQCQSPITPSSILFPTPYSLLPTPQFPPCTKLSFVV